MRTRTLSLASLMATPLIVAASCSSRRPAPPPEHDGGAAHAPLDASPPDAAPEVAPDAAAASSPDAAADAAAEEPECVKDPVAHAARFILDHHAATVAKRLGRAPTLADFRSPNHCFSKSTLPDVDGDGTEEIIVEEECSWGTAASLKLLYFSNRRSRAERGCLLFSGDLVNGGLVPRGTSSGGVRDLEATWSNGCAGGDFTWTHYRWDGKAYRVIDKATCYLCPDPELSHPPPGANAHPHCKAEAKKRRDP